MREASPRAHYQRRNAAQKPLRHIDILKPLLRFEGGNEND